MRLVKRLRKRVAAMTAEATARLSPQTRPRDPLPFSLDWVRRFLPDRFRLPPSALHRDMIGDLAGLSVLRNQHRCYRAPRESAKTTVFLAYCVHCCVEGTEPFILLSASGDDLAKSMLGEVKRELVGNPRIAAAYPHATGEGAVWRDDQIVTRNGVTVVAKGSQAKVLGLQKGGRRPTLVILDEPTERADSYSPTKRRHTLEWFDKSITPIGEAGHTNIIVAGTSVHREALVCVLSNRGTWQSRQYRAIRSYPTNLGLWSEWELIRSNLANGRRLEDASAFYAANRAAMDEGAEVLWPEKQPLAFLMDKRQSMGLAAFGSEYQDHPGADGATEWPSEYFDRPDFWYHADPRPEDVVFRAQAMDPSKGGTGDKPGDYQAHVCCTLTRDGLLWFDARMERQDATRMVDTAVELARQWRPHCLCVEVNSTLGLLAAEFEKRVHLLGDVGLETVTNTDPKAVRIRKVGQYLARGQVRVKNSEGGRLLVNQWRDWPTGEHDDGPDCAGTAVRRIEVECGL